MKSSSVVKRDGGLLLPLLWMNLETIYYARDASTKAADYRTLVTYNV